MTLPMPRKLKCLVVAVALSLADAASAAPTKLGLGIRVDGDGFFLNPVVDQVVVTSVEPHSLAAEAGIVEGDEITSVEGLVVKGRRAGELKRYLDFKAGETRTLTVKHANGATFDARITKPKE